MDIKPMTVTEIETRRNGLLQSTTELRALQDDIKELQKEMAVREAIDCLACSSRCASKDFPQGNDLFAARCLLAAEALVRLAL